MPLPLDDQPITELLHEYRTLRVDRNLTDLDRRIVSARIKQLERQVELRAALTSLTTARERAADRPGAPGARAHPAYLAVGRLASSGVYDGDRLPLLYRVTDPDTDRTIAYVRPEEGVDLTLHLGQQVGVVGQTGFDSELQLAVINVHRVDRVVDVRSAKSAMLVAP